MSYQKVILYGNVGRQPEVREVSGAKVASFALAVSEKYTDRNGTAHETTEWFNVVCWRKQAELVEKYVKKGDKLFLDGKLRTRKFTTQNGEDRAITEMIPDIIQFAGKPGNNQPQSSSALSELTSEDDMPGDEPF